jgi:hypothetical protein
MREGENLSAIDREKAQSMTGDGGSQQRVFTESDNHCFLLGR